jgi:uncharacterized protein YggE
MRVLKVQGKGRVSVEPDLTTLSFYVAVQARDYAECLRNLNASVEDLRAGMAESGLERAQLKTSAYNVHVETKRKGGQNIFVGYVASHTMQIELPMDKELLNKVFRHIAQGHSGAQIRLSFSVRDKDALRRKALAKAVEEARENARTLAEAAGVTLGELRRIDYGWTEVQVRSRLANVMAGSLAEAHEPEVDIEPEDVCAEDSVTLVFEIAA